MATKVEWQTASPLWEVALKDGSDRTRFLRPALLRFDGDTFMEDLQELLDEDPSQLKDLVVRYETWEDEVAGWLTGNERTEEKTPLKLFQPAHARFYLVAASLVCRKPGLPDKCVNRDLEEKVSFVMRRIVTQKGEEFEYGWSESAGWRKVGPVDTVADDEERLPMFTMNFTNRDRRRSLLTGFIPVANRETFQAPAKLSPISLSAADQTAAADAGDPFANMGLARFEGVVVEGLKELRETLRYKPLSISHSQAQEVFLFSLLDFADYIKNYLNNDYSAIGDLDSRFYYEIGSDEILWEDVLKKIMEEDEDIKDKIVLGTITDLSFIIPQNKLTSGAKEIIEDAIDALGILSGPTGGEYQFDDDFKESMETALNDYPDTEDTGADSTPEVPKNEPGVFYVVRCVYERPLCEGIHSPVVSEPSREFQLASFFEPEAPTRPVRITMPADTGIGGLRKFKKNVSIMISDKLRSQMERMTGVKLEDVDDGNIPEEKGFSLGMICSFSIPIITICALIVLFIFLQLLNIVFWWLPFLKICFPFKLKKE